jgi:lipopolysaccharide/colanic/teichoic acid biosynthesis glycosyltransferase
MRTISRLWLSRRLVLVAGDALFFLAAVALVFALRGSEGGGAGPALPFVPVFLFCVLSAHAAGWYELRRVRDFVDLVGGLIASTIGSSVLAIGYFYLLASHLNISPKVTLLSIILIAHAGMFAWRRAVLHVTGFNLIDLNILMVSDQAYRDYLRLPAPGRPSAEVNLVDDLSTSADLVVVDHRWTAQHPESARAILSSAIARSIPVVSLSDFHESLFGTVLPQHANDLAWAVDHVLPRSGSPYFIAKRVIDVLISTVLLLVFFPLFVITAGAIRLVDRISPFYAQRRIGYLGREFRLWKFTTMREGADHAGPFTESSAADPRVTRLGHILRRLRLDELPQLWNVLKGEMSLVGPRPEWEKEAEILERTVPTYRLRYLVPPGLTGWAQVYFHATSSPEESFQKQNYDLYYLKHFSLALDFSIMLKTLKRVFVSDARLISAPLPVPLDSDATAARWSDAGSFVRRRG